MKRLYLLRHAKSSWAQPGLGDIDRPLNERGHYQLGLLSQWMVANNVKIDKALCSVAQRTRETIAGVQQALGNTEVEYIASLYDSTIIDYLNAIWSQEAESLILIGHNPMCDELARYLTAPSSPAAENLMAYHFASATMAVYEFDGKSWADLGEANGRLLELVRTKELERV